MKESNLLCVPLRKTDQAQLAAGLKTRIQNSYNQSADRYQKDLTRIDQLRDSIVNVTAAKENLSRLFEYSAQLSILTTKFSSDIGTEFTWYNTLGYASNAVKYSTLIFDQINVIYNIGSIFSQLAYQEPSNTSDGQKAAYNYYQLAAGTFTYLAEEILPLSEDPLPYGLDKETILALYWLNLAQAHEIFWLRALSDAKRHSIIAKLAAQVSDCYGATLTHANKSNTIKPEWLHHIVCKKWHFSAVAEYRTALDCLEKNKYGEEVARLKKAAADCKEGIANSKYVSGNVLNDIQGLHQRAVDDLKRAEKDNDLIYLQDVPSIANLQKVGRAPQHAAKVPPEIADSSKYLESMNSGPLFNDMLPFTVYQAAKIYAEQVDKYIYTNVTGVLNQLTVKLHQNLEQWNLPGSLDAIEKPLGIPQALLDHADDIKARGGMAELDMWFRDVANLADKANLLIAEAKETLDVEAEEDNMMRQRQGTDRWNRASSQAAAEDLLARYSTNKGYLETAAKSDKLVRDKLESVANLLDVLEAGRPAIEKFVPSSKATQLDRGMQKIVVELRDAVGKTQHLEHFWKQRVQQLTNSLRTLNLAPAMEAYYKRLVSADPGASVTTTTFEPVYQKSLRIYDHDLEWVASQEKAVGAALEEVRRANSLFTQAAAIDQATQNRQQAIQCLEVAFIKYGEIQTNLEEGRKFYNGVLAQLKAFLTDCKNFVYERRVEGRNLEIQIKVQESSDQPVVEQATLESVTPVAPTPVRTASPHPAILQNRTSHLWTPDKNIRFG